MIGDSPTVQWLAGERLHLSHGPIDVVLKAWGEPSSVATAYRAAERRFGTILPELVAELPRLRAEIDPDKPPQSLVGQRMFRACLPFATRFITPMAAVAGSVADELMAAMRAAVPLDRAYVNDGGDIAVHCAPGQTLAIGIAGDFSAGPIPFLNGSIRIGAEDGIGGIATSGAQGRSFSLGIADCVTVLGTDAATADAAATMIANAVDIEDAAIERRPASGLDPDSDLGDRLVTLRVGPLSPEARRAALASGLERAADYHRRGLIVAAALMLQGEVATLSLPRIAGG
jgi:ApbE superfamily uncharacterized protein (UPF0280 family)